MKITPSINLLTCTLILLAIGNHTSAQSYSWSQLNDFGGSVRFGAFNFVIGDYGYMGGGFANGSSVADVWQYDPTNENWTQISDCPLPLRASGNFTLNGKGYVVCGLVGLSTILGNVFSYDPVSNSWTAKANFPGVAIYGGASFEINGKGYFGIGNGGGANGPYYTSFYEYNPSNDTWNQKMSFPGSPRYGTYGLAINGKGYVGFGGDDGSNIFYTDWYQYDPVNNTWTQKANFTGMGRTYPVGFVIDNMGYVGCGINSTTTIGVDFYKYDPIGNLWTVLQNFGGVGRWAASGFAIGDTGYVGTGHDGINYLRDFWKYSPDSSTSITEINTYDITIYPNPCWNTLNIQSDHPDLIENIDIFSIDGKIIMHDKKINLKSYKINISSYEPGIYFVKINFENKSIITKILKI